MRAVVLHEFDTPLILGGIEKPNAGPGQVLVKVRVEAGGVNPLDTKIRAHTSNRRADARRESARSSTERPCV